MAKRKKLKTGDLVKLRREPGKTYAYVQAIKVYKAQDEVATIFFRLAKLE